MKKLFWVSLLFVLSSVSFAKGVQQKSTLQVPILWKLETQPVSWLFGTIHIPDPRVNQLPLAAKLIFNKSDVVLTEIPMEFADTTLAQIKMKRNDGKTLNDVLPEKVQKRLDHYLKEINLPAGLKSMQPLRTWAVYAAVSLLEAQIKHPLTKPLDFNIYTMAKAKGKQVGGLETTAEQLGYFEQFSEAEQVTLLNETLEMLEVDKKTGKNSVEKMLQWYLKGAKTDMEQLMEEIAPEGNDKVLEKKLMDILLIQRNQLMAKRLAKRIKDNPSKRFFVAVGAGHLSGEKNIPFYLEQLGIKSQRFLAH